MQFMITRKERRQLESSPSEGDVRILTLVFGEDWLAGNIQLQVSESDYKQAIVGIRMTLPLSPLPNNLPDYTESPGLQADSTPSDIL